MVFPLAIYLTSVLWNLPTGYSIVSQISFCLFSGCWFGRAVAFMGFVIFLISFVQFIRRQTKIITTGFYSVVRHPQYLGIIIMTLGISIMCFEWKGSLGIFIKYVLGTGYLILEDVWIAWLIQALGYILLAHFEERHLLREYGEEYLQYRQKVPFMLPRRVVNFFTEIKGVEKLSIYPNEIY